MQIYANFKQKIFHYFEFVEIWNFVILVEIYANLCKFSVEFLGSLEFFLDWRWETGGMRIDGRIIRRLWFFVVDWRHKNSWPGLGEQEILGCLIQFTGSWHLPPPGGGSDQCTFAETIQTTRNDARELSFLKLHDSRGSAGNTKLSFRCGAKIKKKNRLHRCRLFFVWLSVSQVQRRPLTLGFFLFLANFIHFFCVPAHIYRISGNSVPPMASS